jgi:putative chitinase
MFAFDREKFLADFPIRSGLPLTPVRHAGLTFLLGKLENDATFTMVRELAYVLATIQWETANTFQPIKERRFNRAKNPKAWESQDRYWRTGFYGRGYVQITWLENYQKAEKKLTGIAVQLAWQLLTIGPGVLTSSPDLMVEADVAYLVCSKGMSQGWFSGKKLSDYIKEGQAPDYVGARWIINGKDHATEIALIANQHELLLRAAM